MTQERIFPVNLSSSLYVPPPTKQECYKGVLGMVEHCQIKETEHVKALPTKERIPPKSTEAPPAAGKVF